MAKIKKYLALILALVMIVSLLNTTVFAAGAEDEIDSQSYQGEANPEPTADPNAEVSGDPADQDGNNLNDEGEGTPETSPAPDTTPAPTEEPADSEQQNDGPVVIDNEPSGEPNEVEEVPFTAALYYSYGTIRVPESEVYPDGKKKAEEFDLNNLPNAVIDLIFTCDDGSTVTETVKLSEGTGTGTYRNCTIKIPANASKVKIVYKEVEIDTTKYVLGTPDNEKELAHNTDGSFKTKYVAIKVNPTPEPIRMILHKVTRDTSASKNNGISDTGNGVFWYLTPEDKTGTIISEEYRKGEVYDLTDRIEQTVEVDGVKYKYDPNDAYSKSSFLKGQAGIGQGDIKADIYVTYDRIYDASEYTATISQENWYYGDEKAPVYSITGPDAKKYGEPLIEYGYSTDHYIGPDAINNYRNLFINEGEDIGGGDIEYRDADGYRYTESGWTDNPCWSEKRLIDTSSWDSYEQFSPVLGGYTVRATWTDPNGNLPTVTAATNYNVYRRPIRIQTPSLAKIYDGKPAEARDCYLVGGEYKGINYYDTLAYNDTLHFDPDSFHSQTDVTVIGVSNSGDAGFNNRCNWWIEDGYGVVVAASYNMGMVENYLILEDIGGIAVYRRPVVFKSENLEKVYDGTALNDFANSGKSVAELIEAGVISCEYDYNEFNDVHATGPNKGVGGLLPEDAEKVTVNFTGTQTEPGTTEKGNRFSINWNGVTMTNYYTGNGYGYLKITGGSVTVNYVDEQGNTLQDSVTTYYGAETPYTVDTPAISGYTYNHYEGSPLSGTVHDGELLEVTLVYNVYTPTPTPTPTYTVTVNYVDDQGNTLQPSTRNGGYYYGKGYTYDHAVGELTGTVRGNVTVTLVYTANEIIDDPDTPLAGTHTLTVHYVDDEGNTLAEDLVETLPEGSEYTVETPAIEGYTYDHAVGELAGVLDDDAVVTLVYTVDIADIPDDEPPLAEDPTDPDPQDPPVDIPDDEPPLAEDPTDSDPQDPPTNIPDDDVPMDDSPKTGDNSNLAVWVTLMILSSIVLVCTNVWTKKNRSYK